MIFFYQQIQETQKVAEGSLEVTNKNCFKLLSEHITYISSDVYKLSNNVKSPEPSKQKKPHREEALRQLFTHTRQTFGTFLKIFLFVEASFESKENCKNCFVRQHALNIFFVYFFSLFSREKTKKHKKSPTEKKERNKNPTKSH